MEHDGKPVRPSLVTVGDVTATLELTEGQAQTHLERARLIEGAPRSLGRYAILECIGQGGMGVVYKAYDPELDRVVAVKVLVGQRSESARARLTREAQALARLSHPHVIAVHDVGLLDGDVFLAMEYVPGPTLRTWLRTPRSRAEILRVFMAAGEGLGAAHRAGLVHRDFKPDNIIIGDDGRVRVLDFGVARTASAEPNAPSVEGADAPLTQASVTDPTSLPIEGSQPGLGTPLTVAGTLVGTPRYMAPEQILARSLDGRADQYAFCLALWEALAGTHPYSEYGLAQLCDRIKSGAHGPPRDAPEIPRWLRKVLTRGLALEPVDRFGSMEALLSALRDDPARRWRRMLYVLGAVMIVGLTAVLARRSSEPTACPDPRQLLAPTWSQAQHQTVRRAFESTGIPFAGVAADRVTARLDRWTAAWVQVHQQACTATRVLGTQSSQLLDLRMECLDQAKRRVSAVVALFAKADSDVVTKSARLVDGLPAIEACSDAAALRASAPLPTDKGRRKKLDEARALLAEAEALRSAGKDKAAATQAQAAIAAARPAGHDPTLAAALLSASNAQERLGSPDVALSNLREAMRTAARGNDRDTEAAAWMTYVQHLSEVRADFAQAELWKDQAGALVERADDAALTGTWWQRLATLAYRQGHYDEAIGRAQKALSYLERLYGPEDHRVTMPLSVIANATDDRGDHAGALPVYERILAIDQNELGREHPWVAADLSNLGTVYANLGRNREALDCHKRALAIFEWSLPGSTRVSDVLQNLGPVYASEGRYAEAAATYERALEIIERVEGKDHPDAAQAMFTYAGTLRERGDAAAARQMLERAIPLWVAAYGDAHPYLALAELTLSQSLADEGRFGDALPHNARARSLYEAVDDQGGVAQTRADAGSILLATRRAGEALTELEAAVTLGQTSLGAEAVLIAPLLVSRSQAERALGRTDVSLATLERAARLVERGGPATVVASARFALASALVDHAPDRARALAVSAREALASADRDAPLRVQVEAWLARPNTARN